MDPPRRNSTGAQARPAEVERRSAGRRLLRRLLRGFDRDGGDRRAVEEAARLLSMAIEHVSEPIVVTDVNGTIQYVNRAFEAVTGYSSGEAVGQTPRILNSGTHDRDFYRDLWTTILEGRVWNGHLRNRRKDGSSYEEDCTISPVRDASGTITHFVSVKRDVTEQRMLESQLQQAQKLEAVGQLSSGIAHEINTPTQYVSDNVRFLRDSFASLSELLSAYGELAAVAREDPVSPDLLEKVRQAEEEGDAEFLLQEIPRAISESLEGLERVASLVRAMKEFAHPGTEEKTFVDLNHALESTVTVARNEWKYVAEVVTELEPDLPQVLCHPGELNQVFLNLLVNAAHAIGGTEKKERSRKGTIGIQTRRDGSWVEVRIRDTGSGIPPEIRDRIFEPFFTTKGVGKGTGQGLAIAYSVIVDKHGGAIRFETEPGEGTTFILRLPIEGS